ncbi:DUF4136 domain-containing protein [Pseudomonas stutzeri]|uniref:DUF4136 domain-containing protein n=1 Tax=Stutzerimonas stutzeri TaxID=316 RepID=UPI001909A363|nr:DUF4136 domain-containing protein [Stutzerimonas stutzeri]MBK3868353.1 DUF4136 domain-containing protein [Stutzerimonas stutzeri]
MLRRLLPIALILALAACQNLQLQRDFDPARDFSAYRNWSWKEPALQYRPDDPRIQSDLTEQRIRDAIAAQLDQRGLRPAAEGAATDLRVQAWYIVDQRTQQYTTTSGAWGNPWYGYWGGPMFTDTRTVDYQVGTLQIDLYDAADGKLVWRGSAEQVLRSPQASPAERAEAAREMVSRVLSQYPPR